ncbi:sulfur carrier protein ThiS [Terriglobus sp.]|uniref:sulfur carrier protein ThiS n=1 Tax=Terriglobus sp. TaxID=1889013 RepID=UPI003B0076E6
MHLRINGDERDFPELQDGADVHALVLQLGFRADRVALERNGDIVPRTAWADTRLAEGDKLEVVHFVGGGLCSPLDD